MKKKHFIAFAKHINQMSNRQEAKAVADAVVAVNDNPQFDKQRFYAACGVSSIEGDKVDCQTLYQLPPNW